MRLLLLPFFVTVVRAANTQETDLCLYRVDIRVFFPPLYSLYLSIYFCSSLSYISLAVFRDAFRFHGSRSQEWNHAPQTLD